MCIQYKGPYSFIVTHLLRRNFKTTMMLKVQLNKWMIKKFKVSGWSSNHLVRRGSDLITDLEAEAKIKRVDTEEEGTCEINIALLHHQVPAHLQKVQVRHLLTLNHRHPWATRTKMRIKRRNKSDWIYEWIDSMEVRLPINARGVTCPFILFETIEMQHINYH